MKRQNRHLVILIVALSFAVMAMCLFTPALSAPRIAAASQPEFETITPAALAAEIKDGKQPRIVCVGFPPLYASAHIPGAPIEGPAREAAGIEKLERWARTVPKGAPVVIYCGCCPFTECPNVHPAWQALRRAGLTNVKVLLLEHSFAKDWVDKGYPTHRVK
ncbi:MAG: rhodanese-like domain-containing protein [Acidobacteriota bacterium]|nr:rhodanese-like domain-containing protein [Acidobacteriota bacterium]